MTSEKLVAVGVLFIFLGIALIILGSFLSSRGGKTEWSVVGFIGPFPIGFGSSKNILFLTLLIAILFLCLFWILSSIR